MCINVNNVFCFTAQPVFSFFPDVQFGETHVNVILCFVCNKSAECGPKRLLFYFVVFLFFL